MPAPRDVDPSPPKPRSRKVLVLWSIALAFLLAAEALKKIKAAQEKK